MNVRDQRLGGPDAPYRKQGKRPKQEQLSLLPVNHGKELCLKAAELLWDGKPGTGADKKLTVCAALSEACYAHFNNIGQYRLVHCELGNRITEKLGLMRSYGPRRNVMDWLAFKGYDVYSVTAVERQAYRKRWLLDMANTYDKGGKP